MNPYLWWAVASFGAIVTASGFLVYCFWPKSHRSALTQDMDQAWRRKRHVVLVKHRNDSQRRIQ